MYCLVLLSALLACAAGVPLDTTKSRPDGRLVGGTITDITRHPYQVSVLNTGSFWCGGTIISANWVLTLAMTVIWWPVSDFSVMSGSSFSTSGGILHRVTSVIVHENYNGSNFMDYNYALLQVFPGFTFSASVQPIALECDPVPAGTDVVLTGWESPWLDFEPLQRVTLQTLNDSSCNTLWGGLFHDRQICAGDPNGVQAGCSDVGSPLVANNKLVGMFNFGHCYPPEPQVYAKVSAACNWIVINAGLYKVSAVINWIENIPGLQKMPLTYIATYPNN